MKSVLSVIPEKNQKLEIIRENYNKIRFQKEKRFTCHSNQLKNITIQPSTNEKDETDIELNKFENL